MKRSAIYARFSTDLQNEKSIDDQILVCRAYAEHHDMTVVETYADRAKSGSSTLDRYDFQKLMRDAEARKFETIIVEDIDRISRDQADFHHVRKMLAFLDIDIHGVHTGRISAIEGSMRAMMGEFFIENLRHKIRRGLVGAVARGNHAGGFVYGYRAVPGRPGEPVVVDEEAAIIRRIFAEYLSGRTPRQIAQRLNAEGVPSPRGGRWNASTINGSRVRANGILQNELYAGTIVWNRGRKVRDPSTGKRISRANPTNEWIRQNVPRLAIVDRDLFDAAQKRKADRAIGHPSHHRRPKHLLSGLLRCGACGAGMSAAGRDKSGKIRVRCSAASESGTCPDPKTFYLSLIEQAVISGLQREMRKPAVIREYVTAYVEERKRLAQTATNDRARLERRLATAQRELDRAIKALIKGTIPEEEGEREVAALRRERDQLRGELALVPIAEQTVALHASILAQYESQLARLRDVLAADITDGDCEAAEAVRDLVASVTVRRDRGGLEVEITGRLTALLSESAFPNKVRSKSVGLVVRKRDSNPRPHHYELYSPQQPVP